MKTLRIQQRSLLRPAAVALGGFFVVLLCASLPLLSQRSVASQAGKEFNEADAALNSAYRTLLASVHDPAERALLVDAQKSWIKFRDDDVAFFAARFPESKGGLFYNIDITRQRTAALKTVLATGFH